MRIPCVLGVVMCLVAGPAEADVSKAWQAAKDNLPANTPIVLAVDVAALQKSPAFPHVLETLKAADRGFRRAYDAFQKGCTIGPLAMVDGFVVAADPKADEIVVYMQLAIDRAKATTCLQSAIALLDPTRGPQMTVKQDGVYTVASKGSGRHDTAYFPWVAPNVVIVSMRPDRKDQVDRWFAQKGFSQSKLSAKVDLKVAISGGLALDQPLDAKLPVIAAHGTVAIAGGKVTASLTATATDAKAGAVLVADLKKEIEHDLKRGSAPPALKKVFGAIVLGGTGAQVTLKGSVTEKDLGAAFADSLRKQEEEAILAKMDEFATWMCSCKDKACADKVNEDMTKWGTELARRAPKAEKPDPAIAKRTADIMMRYSACLSKAMANP